MLFYDSKPPKNTCTLTHLLLHARAQTHKTPQSFTKLHKTPETPSPKYCILPFLLGGSTRGTAAAAASASFYTRIPGQGPKC